MVYKRKRKTGRHLASHSYVRAALRYGICLDVSDQLVIVEQIQDGRCDLIERQSKKQNDLACSLQWGHLGGRIRQTPEGHCDPTPTR